MAKYNYNGPEEFRPLSPWAYFGYSILFSIPFIGLILNLVFCFSDGNTNCKNFARSFWCAYLLIAIIVIVAIVAAVALGLSADRIFEVADGLERNFI